MLFVWVGVFCLADHPAAEILRHGQCGGAWESPSLLGRGDWYCCYPSVLPGAVRGGCVRHITSKKRTGGVLTLGVSLAGFFEP